MGLGNRHITVFFLLILTVLVIQHYHSTISLGQHYWHKELPISGDFNSDCAECSLYPLCHH